MLKVFPTTLLMYCVVLFVTAAPTVKSVSLLMVRTDSESIEICCYSQSSAGSKD